MKSLILFALLLFSFLVVSTADYNDEKMMQDDYCQKVLDGVWTNFKDMECK